MIFELIGLASLLVASAFFSSSEIGYILSNKLKIEIRSRNNILSAKNSFYFVRNPQIYFSTILISDNIVNISFSSFMSIFLTYYFSLTEITIVLISTAFVFLLGELIPKLVATENPDKFFEFTTIPIRIVSFILYPFVYLTAKFSSFITGNKISERGINYILYREDIHTLIDESNEAGNFDEQHTDIIKNVLKMSNQRVVEAMTPRTAIVGIDISSTIEDALDLFIESGYSKLVVYEESTDHIRGIILAYDMFKKPETIESVLREIPYIPESKRSMDTLDELLAKNISTAIVVDEFGGTAGIITIEDVIEEMVGEINDEFDDNEIVNKKINDSTFLFSGKAEIDFINEEFEIGFPDGEYETIAGFITSQIGRIPVKGEKIIIGKFQIEILFADKVKIELIKVKIRA